MGSLGWFSPLHSFFLILQLLDLQISPYRWRFCSRRLLLGVSPFLVMNQFQHLGFSSWGSTICGFCRIV